MALVPSQARFVPQLFADQESHALSILHTGKSRKTLSSHINAEEKLVASLVG